MRIAVAQILQETNTFSPIPTTLETFQRYYYLKGEEMLDGLEGQRIEIPGMLSVLRSSNVQVVPLLATSACASGTLTRETYETLTGELMSRLKAAGKVDAVLLALHGAMAAEGEDDPDGAIIEMVRRHVGPDVPIGVSFDLHALITRRMLQPNVFHVGYKEYPHIDMFETGERTAQLMLDTLAGKKKPVMSLVKLPLLVSPMVTRTTDGPLRPVVERAREMEAKGEVLHASLFPVQPWLDLPDLGFAVLVCGDGDQATCDAAANELASMVWNRRKEFETNLLPVEETIEIAMKSSGVTVVGDSGDAPTGGSASDSTAVLAGLLKKGADKWERPSLLSFVDPEVAREAAAAGVGTTKKFRLGYKITKDAGTPIEVTARVTTISEGVYAQRDKGAKGMKIDNGLTAVLAIGAIRIAVRSYPAMEWDTGMYYSVGLDPTEAGLVFVKSPSHFRVAYGPFADRILMADTPGPTLGNMRNLTLKRAPRPLYPLDESASWSPA
ncbi:MAG: M81 family metallopeptidase [Alphaproteobacteria bacterium]|nr:M81 family metallopeptidase [Alphaproteobacteria bacterium]